MQEALASPRALPREPCPPTELEAAVFGPVVTGLIVGVQPAAAAASEVVIAATEGAPAEEVMVAAVVEPGDVPAVVIVQAATATDEGEALVREPLCCCPAHQQSS